MAGDVTRTMEMTAVTDEEIIGGPAVAVVGVDDVPVVVLMIDIVGVTVLGIVLVPQAAGLYTSTGTFLLLALST